MTKIIVFVSGVEGVGADENAAKAKLNENAEREKARGAEQCTKGHENQAGCVAAKMTSLVATMQSLGFSARKLLEESIASDCKAQQGKCGDVTVSDPQCSERITGPGTESKDGGKEAGKEGGKEAGKKKK